MWGKKDLTRKYSREWKIKDKSDDIKEKRFQNHSTCKCKGIENSIRGEITNRGLKMD